MRCMCGLQTGRAYNPARRARLLHPDEAHKFAPDPIANPVGGLVRKNSENGIETGAGM